LSGESTPFADNTFDLVTVAQAYHWIKWDEFRKEAAGFVNPKLSLPFGPITETN
jgi:hypothetical protein